MSDQTVSCLAQVLELPFSVSLNQQEMYFKCLMFVCTWQSLPQTCPDPLLPSNHYRPANNAKSSCFTFRCTLGLKYWKSWRKIGYPTEQTVPVLLIVQASRCSLSRAALFKTVWRMQTFDSPSPDSSVWILSLLSPDSEVVHTLHLAEPKVELLSQHQSVVHKETSGRHFPSLLLLLLHSAYLWSKTEARKFSRFLFVHNLTMLFLPFQKPELKQKKQLNSDLCWCWQLLDLNWVCFFSFSLNLGSAVWTGAESGWSFSQSNPSLFWFAPFGSSCLKGNGQPGCFFMWRGMSGSLAELPRPLPASPFTERPPTPDHTATNQTNWWVKTQAGSQHARQLDSAADLNLLWLFLPLKVKPICASVM